MFARSRVGCGWVFPALQGKESLHTELVRAICIARYFEDTVKVIRPSDAVNGIDDAVVNHWGGLAKPLRGTGKSRAGFFNIIVINGLDRFDGYGRI